MSENQLEKIKIISAEKSNRTTAKGKHWYIVKFVNSQGQTITGTTFDGRSQEYEGKEVDANVWENDQGYINIKLHPKATASGVGGENIEKLLTDILHELRVFTSAFVHVKPLSANPEDIEPTEEYEGDIEPF